MWRSPEKNDKLKLSYYCCDHHIYLTLRQRSRAQVRISGTAGFRRATWCALFVGLLLIIPGLIKDPYLDI